MSNNDSRQTMGAAVEVTLDLADALALITETARVLTRMNGQRGPVDVDRGPARRSNAARAAVARDLLRTEHLLKLAAAEVAAQYWTLKGCDDPRFDDATGGPSDLGRAESAVDEPRRGRRAA